MTEPTPHLEGFRRKPIARRVLAVALTAAIAATGSVLAAAPAQAAAPKGSAQELVVGTRTAAYQPVLVQTSGTWGGPIYPASTTATDAAAFGCAAGDGLARAFTTTSSDGSNEEPAVPSATTVASEVYTWTNVTNPVDYLFNGGDAGGAPDIDQAGDPVSATTNQLYTNDQQVAKLAGQTVTPAVVRLRQQWPTGTLISLVEFCSPGLDSVKNQPIVSRDSSGHAIASWLTFRTVANPTTPAYTSNNFVVISPVQPAIPLEATFTADGTSGTLTATLTGSTGATLTDATGSVAFYAGSTTTGTPFATDTTVVDGVASVPLTGLKPGSTVSYTAVYTPDASLTEKYASSTSDTSTFEITAVATTTSLTTSGSLEDGGTQVLSAKVTPATAVGSIRFLDGTTVLGEKSIAAGSAQLETNLGAGTHNVTAQFLPASNAYKTSVSSAKAMTVSARPEPTPTPTPSETSPAVVTQPVVTPPVVTPPVVTPPAVTAPVVTKPVAKAVAKSVVKVSKSKAVVKKTVLKATITITVPGTKTKPTGKVTITVNGKKIKTVTLKASNKGKVTVSLPKFTKVNAKTKIVASYAGTSTIAAAKSKTAMVRVSK